jgi:Na+-transporting methylmalonyl-CoA/oxaloacetate decarboxylase gamma subunit
MSDFLLSLQITALGMGLVFGAILLLWLMMVLLTLFTTEKEHASLPTPEPAPVSETGFKAQAAAIAVAIALAEQGQSTARPLTEPPTAIVSAWQLGMRTRQMSEKGSSRRR